MIVHRAEHLLPISGPPIRNGWVAIDEGRIAGCGAGNSPPGAPGRRPFAADQPFVVLPALVNAHTHIELSWMRGRVPPGGRFDDWIRGLVALRRGLPDAASLAIVDRAREAIEALRASGTGVVGDIANTLVTVPLFRQAGLAARVFYEVLGFNAPDAAAIVRRARGQIDALQDSRVSVVPHAPYSVSPALFAAIRQDLEAHPDAVGSVHLAESRDEVEFLRHGSGAIRVALEELGAWNGEWTPPGCDPVEYIDRLGLLSNRVLIVHAVQLTRGELDRVRAAGAAIVTCPRSNRWTGAGVPPLADFYASGVRVAIGTDSLASGDDLNLFNELAAVRALAPDVPAARILESATRIGAEALAFGDTHGTIEPGKRADLIAVRVPADVVDVEKYLLTGIQPVDVRWLDGEP